MGRGLKREKQKPSRGMKMEESHVKVHYQKSPMEGIFDSYFREPPETP